MVKTLLRRFYTMFATNILDIPPRLLSFLLFLLLLSLPLTGLGEYFLGILILANINALFAASWDILVGRTGQISLGHALFFGVGAYASALFYKYCALPPWVTLFLGIPFGVIVALLVGFPSLRVKGPYLALVTLAFPLILIRLFFVDIPGIINIRAITGGETPISVPRFLAIPPYSPCQARIVEYYFSLLLLSVCAFVLYKIARSKAGIVFVSILDDESASKASGINTTKYKLMAFAISAFFASLVGSFYAHYMTGAGLSTLMFGEPSVAGVIPGSFTVIIITILGGIGTIYGPVVGAYILTFLSVFLRQIMQIISASTNLSLPVEEWSFLIYIIVVVAFIIVWQKGVATSIVEKLDELTETEEIRKERRKGKRR